MFDCERANAHGERAIFLGQGYTKAEAEKEGWENACDDFGKSSSGAPPISRARLAVILPSGDRVLRTPKAFIAGPYNPAEYIAAPGETLTPAGPAQQTHQRQETK
jgi:hypothetical protein